MDTQPSGYLPMKERPKPGDKLIFIPVYIAPVEILERSLMHGPRYIYQVVIVDGYNGKTTLVDKKALPPETDFVPEAEEEERLELKISPALAKELAEYGAIPSDFQNWEKIIRNRQEEPGSDNKENTKSCGKGRGRGKSKASEVC